MFARVQAVLASVESATIVPIEALAQRGGRPVVFVVNDAGDTATMVPVDLGLANATHSQVTGEGVLGRVVTLGQQLLGERTPIVIPTQDPPGQTQGEGG